MASLLVAFFVAALLYASVGFGGGSTYTALLALAEVDYRLLPLLSLACNIVVVAGSSVRFARAKVTPWRNALVLTGIAAPAALLGGLTPIDEATFLAILGASLVLTALTLLLPSRDATAAEPTRFSGLMPVLAVPFGYLAGLVGIGGGIFLAPFLHLARWDSARAIAATASLFILVNSLFGLAGQLLKGGTGRLGAAVDLGLPLLVAVAIGGQIGSLLALKYLPQRWIRYGTAALTAWVGGRLLLNV
ncbi:sulfite exporter TauE/SafE family protein [Qipengyuania sp. SS22]|uniref:sulfite exporter TauE/SafE family protein n=1 Tax=Qipengyuania sp. SS22 TaxID=2979461 RepID=UPI0021E600B2|nr:sulfite exporter TauE/SafE family protein [Qipengyuania sp. SS22]UYH55614.1 sulfite exporter TauE/SafE family protein [Qipengyuania sp. SS22]